MRFVILLGLVAALTLCVGATPGGGQPSSPAEAALLYLRNRGLNAYNRELLDLVSIPSVSSLPEHQADILRAAAWLETRMQTAGLQAVRTIPTEGPRPVVYGEHLHAPGAPTVLIYGHYDVQPAEDTAALWTSPPFKPEVRLDRFWGRGVHDDKGSGVLPPLQAIEALLRTSGQLPLNIKVMLEGEEEVGSPHLDAFLAANADLLACDFVLSADGGQISETQPALSLGLRGALAVQVDLTTAKVDVHSGMAGGAVQNPARALAQLLATMWHPNNSVAIAGWYDNVRPITDADRDDMLAYNFNEESELLGPLGAIEPVGEAGYSSLERLWHRPTLEVVGMGSGFQGAGIKTIVPHHAFAKLAARLVPDQTPDEIEALIRSHVSAHLPPATNVTIRALGFRAHPYTQAKDSMPNRVAAQVLERLMGNPPKYVRSGATIPALAAFQKHLNATTTVFAFGLPDGNLHAPDENLPVSMYRLARKAWVEYLCALGDAAAAEGGIRTEGGASGRPQAEDNEAAEQATADDGEGDSEHTPERSEL